MAADRGFDDPERGPVLAALLAVDTSRQAHMKTAQAVQALAALAQDTRLAIYRLLVQRGPAGLAAGVIAERLGLAGATLSFHLKELTHAGMIVPRQEGRFVYYSANYGQMNALLGYLSENCCQGEGCVTVAPPKAQRKRA
jgi:ArsR family transcriptional regulator, arsenate/arsenite/antimonite-responsive transcriptional repressor